jgi:plasmid stabilization system protein ParE
MRYRVRHAQRAERDLDLIADWYLERHPDGLSRFTHDFGTLIALLAAFPLAGRERAEYRAGLRSWNVHPFVVFYTVDETKQIVTIRTIMHGSMDLDDLETF